MPIFTRRQLQNMLNELGPRLTLSKATDLLKRLEHKNPNKAIPAEFELALGWAVAQNASLEIDRPMGNNTPDIYSPDIFLDAPVSIDVAAVSDASLSGEAFMRRAAKIINRTCEQILKGSAAHLHYEFQEWSGYVRDEQGRTRFSRRRRINEFFQMNAGVESSLGAWLTNSPTTRPVRLTAENIDVVVTWRNYVHPLANTFCTMPSLAYDLRENALYQVLESKALQLRDVSDGVHRGIFLGDAGCQLFNNIDRVDRVNQTYSGGQIIEEFLASESTVHFVAVFSVRRSKEGSWDSATNPRLWYVYLFKQRHPSKEIDLRPIERLGRLLPAPRFTGYEARSRHEQGMFSPQDNEWYVPTHMSIGRQTMTAKVSARALQELIAGRLTAEQFQHWITGRPNAFEQQLTQGRVISSVSFQPKGHDDDDDYVTFTFKGDPAASPLVMPNDLLNQQK